MDYKLGEKYRISSISRKKKNENRFTGMLVRHDKRHFTLENNNGIKETFLKIDIKIGEYSIASL